MLRAGGRVVHMSPSNNYVNHGFVQLSPAFYHDYYVANGYEDVRARIMVVQPRADILTTEWNLLQYDHAVMGGVDSLFCTGETMMAVYFSARKTAASTSDRVPVSSPVARRGEPERPRASSSSPMVKATRTFSRSPKMIPASWWPSTKSCTSDSRRDVHLPSVRISLAQPFEQAASAIHRTPSGEGCTASGKSSIEEAPERRKGQIDQGRFGLPSACSLNASVAA